MPCLESGNLTICGKARIKECIANGIAPGFERYMEKLKREFARNE